MPTPIKVTVNDREVQQLFRDVTRRVRDTEPAMKEIGEVLLLSTDQRFEQEQDPQGRRWAALRPSTIARKRVLGRILKILQETGTGRAGINYRTTPNSVAVGTPSKYMADHQLGRGQTVRQFLGLSADDLNESKIILRNYVIRGKR